MKEFNGDRQRHCLTGLSMGGTLCLNCAAGTSQPGLKRMRSLAPGPSSELTYARRVARGRGRRSRTSRTGDHI